MRRKPIFIAVLWTCLTVWGCGTSKGDAPKSTEEDTPASEVKGPQVTCPVCDLTFPKSEAVGSVTVKSKKYYFFLKDHLKAFQEDPTAYLMGE